MIDSFLNQAISLTSNYSLWLILAFFAVTSMGELSISVPYALESMWLVVGHQLGVFNFSPIEVIILWLSAVIGREMGAILLFYAARFGADRVGRLIHHFYKPRPKKHPGFASRSWEHLNRLSPFSIGIGRLFALRVPLTLSLGARNRLKPLIVGVIISSIIFDGAYIGLGLLGGTVHVSTGWMLVYTLSGMSVLYATYYGLKRLFKRFVAQLRQLHSAGALPVPSHSNG